MGEGTGAGCQAKKSEYMGLLMWGSNRVLSMFFASGMLKRTGPVIIELKTRTAAVVSYRVRHNLQVVNRIKGKWQLQAEAQSTIFLIRTSSFHSLITSQSYSSGA